VPRADVEGFLIGSFFLRWTWRVPRAVHFRDRIRVLFRLLDFLAGI